MCSRRTLIWPAWRWFSDIGARCSEYGLEHSTTVAAKMNSHRRKSDNVRDLLDELDSVADAYRESKSCVGRSTEASKRLEEFLDHLYSSPFADRLAVMRQIHWKFWRYPKALRETINRADAWTDTGRELDNDRCQEDDKE